MTPEQALLNATREFLWAGLCWNDHTFREGALAKKCRKVCEDMGIQSVEQANVALANLELRLSQLEDDPEKSSD